ncbi:hypothetical protein COV93_03605 [Candidatus Woesearchaeota archaeon CG11_big_fil_rev_8_21_14_0_20_43_8]|nr:MAG: hypothetical protein COV93_03605 [Candidatus Woesearchaeota archaeon CG11_big_fil_rev_8_21_14_0_20_43_8]PIO05362.1 MAG: hypothetical protein COT47_05140 [Candidatus Woesearchaeota archaeon CG08_land_8_20_14_0_20_43_7]
MISIIGAGPAGCYLGYLLAKKGQNVQIFEEHKEVGHPIQCTGIVTRRICAILDIPKSIILNKVKRMQVHSPDGAKISIPNNDLVIDRSLFDQYLAKLAKASGVRILTGHKFLKITKMGVMAISKGRSKEYGCDILIGADGPGSNVAKQAGIFGSRSFYTGIQIRVKGRFDRNAYQVHLDVPGFFGWIVPESEKIARIGLAVQKHPNERFNRFLEKLNLKGAGWKRNIIDSQAGLIPIYDPDLPMHKHLHGKDIFLLGDAATQVKATTGGGIVQALMAAEALCDTITNGVSYEKSIKKLRKELGLHLKIRKTLNRFSDQDYNRLIEEFNSSKIKKVLKNNTRDQPIKLMISLLLAKPRLLLFGRFLLGL